MLLFVSTSDYEKQVVTNINLISPKLFSRAISKKSNVIFVETNFGDHCNIYVSNKHPLTDCTFVNLKCICTI